MASANISGIDWHIWPTERPFGIGHYDIPGIDAHEYNEYAWKHCADLIERYQPYVLWGDIDWPKA
jgi:alpha-L-fucosidase